MYMVAQGFHDDKRIEPPLRSLIFQAANSDVCKKFVSKIHLLEDKNEEERPAAQLGGEARAKYLFERQKLAPYVGSSFVFTALRYSSAVALPEKTRAIYGNLAKAYLMGKELRSNRAVLKLNTKIQNPVDGKVCSILSVYKKCFKFKQHRFLFFVLGARGLCVGSGAASV